jgi:2-keto-4-pentenoate hydratase
LKQVNRMHAHSSRVEDNSQKPGKHGLGRLLLLASALLICTAACVSTQNRAARQIFDAWNRSASLPHATRIGETLTIQSAYAIQREFVRKRLESASITGFKAGLTTPGSQARFHADSPIAGVLIGAPLHDSPTLRLSQLRGLNIETEVALRVGTPIDRPLPDIAALRAHVDGIAPALELPNLDYESAANLDVRDIVASNVAAAAYLVGPFESPQQRDPNSVHTRLVCEGKELNVGAARDALGDQWEAARWLVNTMVDQGYRIERGHILLTGALGRMIPAQPGACTASFDDWGVLAITVAP